MRKWSSKLHMNSLLALLLFAVFAVSILSVLATGAGIYKRLVERDDAAYTWRTAERYISAKVRQCASAEGVCVENFGDGDALTLREEIGGAVFLTRIYCSEGYLRELFSMEGSPMTPEDGEKILPMAALEAQCFNGLLTLHLIDGEGVRRELLLALRSGVRGLL